MPLTETDGPILLSFLCAVELATGMPAQPLEAGKQLNEAVDSTPKKLPRGVVLGPDGKP
jgi:hypothetical protein